MLVLVALLYLIALTQSYVPSHRSLRHGGARGRVDRRLLLRVGATTTIDALRPDIMSYLAARNSTTPDELVSKDYVPVSNPFEMLKPSGWYKDTEALDLQRRTDRRIPKVSHPLSYVELQRYGWGNLSLPIMELGGPLVVGEQVGVEWQEPEKEVWDEALRPVREETYALDVSGSLQVHYLHDILFFLCQSASSSHAPTHPLWHVRSSGGRSTTSWRQPRGSTWPRSSSRSRGTQPLPRSARMTCGRGRKFTGWTRTGTRTTARPKYVSSMAYGSFIGACPSRRRHTASRPPVAPSQVRVKRSMPVSTEPKVPRSEKFTLTYPQRLNLVLVLFSTAAAYGRASAGLAADPAWGEVAGSASSVAVVVSAVLGVAAAGSLGVCVRLAREKNRNAVVWGAKGLLGGPLAVTQLRGLDPL